MKKEIMELIDFMFKVSMGLLLFVVGLYVVACIRDPGFFTFLMGRMEQ